MTALHMMAAKGNLDLIDKLVAMGANIDAKDVDVTPHSPPQTASSYPTSMH
jgi:ankyrin repeat protein